MRIVVVNTLDDLAADMAAIPGEFKAQAPGVVEKYAAEGLKVAQRFARERSGKHGSAYWKRLSSEMVGPLSAEYGPHDGGTPVGAGWRHKGPNMDLPNSADLIGPKFADAVGDLAEGLFE